MTIHVRKMFPDMLDTSDSYSRYPDASIPLSNSLSRNEQTALDRKKDIDARRKKAEQALGTGNYADGGTFAPGAPYRDPNIERLRAEDIAKKQAEAAAKRPLESQIYDGFVNDFNESQKKQAAYNDAYKAGAPLPELDKRNYVAEQGALNAITTGGSSGPLQRFANSISAAAPAATAAVTTPTVTTPPVAGPPAAANGGGDNGQGNYWIASDGVRRDITWDSKGNITGGLRNQNDPGVAADRAANNRAIVNSTTPLINSDPNAYSSTLKRKQMGA